MLPQEKKRYPQALYTLALAFMDAGFVLYAVGGHVRDILMGTEVTGDIDLCGAMLPKDILSLCEAHAIQAQATHAELGTVLLKMEDISYEYTSFRTESYASCGAHRPKHIQFTNDILQDAQRRDFTVNALYENIWSGEILDPSAYGLQDMQAKILRCVHVKTLQNDALRILRLCRLVAQLGFAVEKDTLLAAKANAGGLSELSQFRKSVELKRILLLPHPLDALSLLHKIDALPYLLPEIIPCVDFPQNPRYHAHEDLLEHLFQTTACAPPELPLRLAALLHDIGKPQDYENSGNFHRHAEISAHMAETVLKRMGYASAICERTVHAIRRHMFDLDARAKIKTLRSTFARWGRQGTEDVIALREADVRGSGIDTSYTAKRWREVYVAMQRDGTPFSLSELAVTGADILAIKEVTGPQIGALLRRLLLHCAVHPKDNTRPRLLRILRDM